MAYNTYLVGLPKTNPLGRADGEVSILRLGVPRIYSGVKMAIRSLKVRIALGLTDPNHIIFTDEVSQIPEMRMYIEEIKKPKENLSKSPESGLEIIAETASPSL